MEYVDIGRVLASLLGVVALILLSAWIAKRVGLEKRLGALRGDTRLKVVESLHLDAKHRAVILRRDGREHVLLVSATDTLVVESYDVPTDKA